MYDPRGRVSRIYATCKFESSPEAVETNIRGRSSRQIDESNSCRFLPAKLMSRFLLPLSSRQIDESIISIADFFVPPPATYEPPVLVGMQGT